MFPSSTIVHPGVRDVRHEKSPKVHQCGVACIEGRGQVNRKGWRFVHRRQLNQGEGGRLDFEE
jgi:hypothetical protein